MSNAYLSNYQTYIHLSRYARWNDKEKRRETWDETVNRYIAFFVEHLRDNHNYEISTELREEIREAITNFEVMPSMRAMWTAGAALKRDNIAGYNCLGGETLVTTKEYGIVPIRTLDGKSVHVVDGNGAWTLATCKSYGTQQLYTINIGTSGQGEFSIRATADHRWILRDGREVTTNILGNGDRLASVAMPPRPNIDEQSPDYVNGVVHGIIYGDGQAIYKSRAGGRSTYVERVCSGFAIRLCDKSRPLEQYFVDYTRSYPKSYNGDPVIYVRDRSIDIKSVPDVGTGMFTDSYLVGFIRGWLAADGSVTTKGGQVCLTGNDEGVSWIKKYGPRFGFCTTNVHKHEHNTSFNRTRDTYNVYFDRRWLVPQDFLLEYKRSRFNSIDINKSPGFGLVKSITPATVEEVFCFDVPTTHSFLLTKNLLTGNCAYIPVNRVTAFDEILFLLMNGTGVGFSVERQFISELPVIADEFHKSNINIVVEDSKQGWAKALKELLHLLYAGQIPSWDLAKLRGPGAPLKTFGGRSSGPEPLNQLFIFACNLFKNAAGRKLTSVECHDLACKIADIVVVGGVRRSALISLSNLSDDRMRYAKSGNWWDTNVHRQLANNSTAYTEKPDIGIFMKEWLSLYDSKSGERGIFNRVSAQKKVASLGRRDPKHDFGVNPCGEVILRPYEFCNLSEAVVRHDDTPETLARKVRIASIIGTFQSTLTNFKYINKKWQKNCEEERLLGVSLTGIMDNNITSGKSVRGVLEKVLTDLRNIVVDTNREYAGYLGINPSAATTVVKPSGTVSQLVDAASGIHARHSRYYVRNVRQDKKDPIGQFMKARGFPCEDDVTKPDHTWVFSFPIKSPDESVLRDEMSAIDQLEIWKIYRTYWTEHNPSVTISVKEHEWMEVGAWVYKNWDDVCGLSFLPHSDHVYRQAPYEECDVDTYNRLVAAMPSDIKWSELAAFEQEDNTEGAGNYACVAGACDII